MAHQQTTQQQSEQGPSGPSGPSGLPALNSDGLAGLVQSLTEPLVCVKYGAQWCVPCKQIAPLYASLAQNAVGSIRCFTVDVETPQGEQLALNDNVSSLPTFVFYTTQLSPNNELQRVETVVGSQAAALQVNFAKGVKLAQAFLAQAPPAQQGQAQAPPGQAQVPQAPQTPQGSVAQGHSVPLAHAVGNDAIKKELLDIRATLVAALQRVEKLYTAIQ